MNKAFEKIMKRLEEVESRLLNESVDIGCTLGITNMSEYSKQIVQEVAEEYNGGWIPCSERLPEDKGKYLVCDNKGNVCSSEYYFNCWLAISSTDEVIAWQSLPDPYQPKGE